MKIKYSRRGRKWKDRVHTIVSREESKREWREKKKRNRNAHGDALPEYFERGKEYGG